MKNSVVEGLVQLLGEGFSAIGHSVNAIDILLPGGLLAFRYHFGVTYLAGKRTVGVQSGSTRRFPGILEGQHRALPAKKIARANSVTAFEAFR
jgi:hypothetical protein